MQHATAWQCALASPDHGILCGRLRRWFHKDVDRCFVATEDTARRARSMGLQDSQIVVHGLPIRPAFARRQPSKKSLRGKLGALTLSSCTVKPACDAASSLATEDCCKPKHRAIAQVVYFRVWAPKPTEKLACAVAGLQKDVPAVLVVAGGEGMGPVEKTCSAIARASGASVQLVVVTGRNARLAERLRLRQWPSGMHVAVQVSSFLPAQCCRAAHHAQAQEHVPRLHPAKRCRAVDVPSQAPEPAPRLPSTNGL